MHDRRLIDWLLSTGRDASGVESLLMGFVPELRGRVPVDRMWLGTSVLHPQTAAYVWTWADEAVSSTTHSHERFATLDDIDTPMRRLRLGAPFVRVREGDADASALADVQKLFAQGYMDFYATPLVIRGQWAGGFTWATRHPKGFTRADIGEIDRLLPALSAIIDPMVRESMYNTLLCSYLGDDAGRRVAAGQVRRGDGQVLRAAILFSDVRGFTTMSQDLPSHELLGLLGDVLERSVGAIHDHGGQVLKFMGDGLLAVFIEDARRSAEAACTAATDAARDLQERIAALRVQRAAQGAPVASVGVGLHYGDAVYGNIGGGSRLDFTVIGPSVNLAARVEGACSALGEPILATDAVATRAAGWEALAAVPMKGIAEPVQVFRPLAP